MGCGKKVTLEQNETQERIFRKNENSLGIFFYSKNGLPFRQNIILDKCVLVKDARVGRTCVVNTEITPLGSKNAILAVKMLKIRKKCLTMAFFCWISSKNTEKYLTFWEK